MKQYKQYLVIGIMAIALYAMIQFNNNKLSNEISTITPLTVLSLDKTFRTLTIHTQNKIFTIHRNISKNSSNARYFTKGTKVWVLPTKVIIKTRYNNYQSYKFLS